MTEIEKLGVKYPNKYMLSNVISRRAKQLLSGAAVLVETEDRKAIDIAITELAEGKVTTINGKGKASKA